MPKDQFRFKQFTICQDRCAMKVGTDGVALGAWAPVAGVQRILDIGTGTGLIALMLAQRSAPECRIVALELDEAAAAQAAENVAVSPWPQKIRVAQGALQQWQDDRYDLIVSNPPYYRHGQVLPSEARRQARHTATLSHVELLEHALRLLLPTGKLALVLPVAEGRELIALAAQMGLHLQLCQQLIPKPGKEVNRFLLLFSREIAKPTWLESIICTENGEYHESYRQMVAPFYLKL